MKFEVGQELYVVLNERRGGPRIETVTSIGRKWVNLTNGWRFDHADMRLDGKGYSSPGKVYQSEAEHNNWLELDRTWRSFMCAMDRQFSPPSGMSIEKIQAIRSIIWPSKGGEPTTS